MNKKRNRTRPVAVTAAIAAFAVSAVSFAAQTTPQNPKAKISKVDDRKETRQDAIEQVKESTQVAQKMQSDAEMKKLLQQAKGVFLVPHYARAAFVVGGRGGEGILLVKQAADWSDPAFYNFGGVSAGIQGGVEAGSIALVLMNEKAVQSFQQKNNFSLNADAGLTLVNWSKKGQASAGKGDVIVWADTEGLFGDASISFTDIHFDKEETAAFFGKTITLNEIFTGNAMAKQPQLAALKKALPTGVNTMSGSSTVDQ